MNRARIELTGFYSYLDQAIVRRDFQLNGQDSIIYDGELSRVQAMVNTGYANVYGTSLSIYIKLFNNFVLNSSLTYIKGER